MKNPCEKFDVIIIGGGPAGMSSVLWCCDMGLRPVLLERASDLGGQMHQIHNPIKNYLGLEAKDGEEMARTFKKSLERLEFERSIGVDVIHLDLRQKFARLADGREFVGDSLILATGVRRRRLDVRGEVEFEGRGVLTSGVSEKGAVAGKRVVIVGGGDAALENSLILSEVALTVTVVHRRSEFSARSHFVDEANLKPNIDFMTETTVSSINGDERIRSVSVTKRYEEKESLIQADFVLVRVGVVPNNELFVNELQTDPRGYVIVNERAETSLEGVFAVGDVANPMSPTINTAVGTGTTAVKSISTNSIVQG